jgi:hypothetical protein
VTRNALYFVKAGVLGRLITSSPIKQSSIRRVKFENEIWLPDSHLRKTLSAGVVPGLEPIS